MTIRPIRPIRRIRRIGPIKTLQPPYGSEAVTVTSYSLSSGPVT